MKRVRRIECCLAVDAVVKGRRSLNKVAEPGLCKWMARFCEADSSRFPRRRAPATSGRFRRKWAPISPWALGFWVVVGGSRSPSSSPTWGNTGVWWCFGLVRPAKPPEVCSSQAEFAGSSGTGGRCKACWLHRRLSDWRSRSVAAKLWRADDEVDARQLYGRFLAMVSGGVLLTSIWVSILVTKVRRNGGLTETLKGRRCRPRVSATFPLTPVR